MRLAPFLLLVSLFSAPLQAACERPLRVFLEHWPPYSRVLDADLPSGPVVDGIDVRILRAVMKHADCPVEWVRLPVERASKALRVGDIDLMMAASRIPERESHAWFSVPYRLETVEVVGRLDAARHANWDSLVSDGVRLMAPRSGWYGRAYQRARPALLAAGQLLFMDNYRAGVAMLKTGRVDRIMGDRLALRHAAHEVGVVLSYPLLAPHQTPVHFMYSRKSVPLTVVAHVDQSIRALEALGVLARLQVDTLP